MTNPFQFSNGQQAHNAEDLLELCQQFPDDGVHYLVREDLEKWLSYIGKEDIAQCAASARQTPLDDRQKLEEFLNKCHALSSPVTRDSIEEATEAASPTVETPEEHKTAPAEKPIVEEKNSQPTAPETPTAQSKSAANPTIEPTTTKPSFFKVIARLIVNILYRGKDKN